MTNANTSSAPNDSTPETFDRADISRSISMARHEITALVNDSARKRPFFAKTPADAVARRDAAVALLEKLLVDLDKIKKG